MNLTPTTMLHAYRDEIVAAWEIKQRADAGMLRQVFGFDCRGNVRVMRETFEPAPPRPCYWWVHV